MRRTRDKAGYQRFHEYLVEVGLEPQIRCICLQHTVTPRDIYLDTLGPSATGARLEVWWWLMKEIGKSKSEIGKLFDRDPTSVTHALKRLYKTADAADRDVEAATVHELCRTVAREINQNREESGRNVAKLGTGTEASLRARGARDE